MNDLLAAYDHTTDNRSELERSGLCGCCSCTAVFPTEDIMAWTGLDTSSFDQADEANGGTGVCPRCGAEALLGDAAGFVLSPEFLGRMNQAWFQRTIIRRPNPKT